MFRVMALDLWRDRPALAMTFLGEHMTVRRWIAAGIIAIGAIMLQMGS